MNAIENANLPIVDLTGFKHGDSATRQKVADLAVHACETSGFFYITGHGIPDDLFSQAKASALDFFRGPADVKAEVHISQFPHHRGYVGNFDVAPDTQKGGDVREAYKVALDLDETDPDYQAGITLYGPNVWPRDLPKFQSDLSHTYTCFQQLARDIFNLFALGLQLPQDYFDPLIEKPASVMNVNYYPATSSEEDKQTSGIGAHSDYEAFAMLWQDDVGGLQIESLQGEWQAVQPLPGALVINIGDLMAHWTNDRFRATRHRVINTSGKERVSIACFGNTNYHAMIECIPSCYSDSNPPKYPPTKCGDYLMGAIKRTYAYAQR
ncbi:MAG: 2OG-Fe(II) oxygenase family protein [Pseudomonadota bacterium]